MYRHEKDIENLDPETMDIIHIIGKIEVDKRKIGLSEQDLYVIEMELKRGLRSEGSRVELLKKWGLPIEELKNMYDDFRFRRKFYRILKKEAKEEYRKIEEKSKENSKNIKDSQIIKEE